MTVLVGVNLKGIMIRQLFRERRGTHSHVFLNRRILTLGVSHPNIRVTVDLKYAQPGHDLNGRVYRSVFGSAEEIRVGGSPSHHGRRTIQCSASPPPFLVGPMFEGTVT